MPSTSPRATIRPLRPLQPDLYARAWVSLPHPTLPLIATAHAKAVTIFSLTTFTRHSIITNGHEKSIRSVAWKPNLPSGDLCLVTGSFDCTSGIWRWGEEENSDEDEEDEDSMTFGHGSGGGGSGGLAIDVAKKLRGEEEKGKDWNLILVLEGHESEIKSTAFSPSGAHIASCSRDKSIWIWEDIGDTESADEWETIAILSEHDGDVKMVAWCPDTPGRNARRTYSSDVLASASYDDTVRVWREDGDGEWICVEVLEGHGGTVWGVEWEGRQREDNKFPRLASFSADGSVRIWKLKADDPSEETTAVGHGEGVERGLGGVPNTMRRSTKEEWTCEAVLPKIHLKDIYSISWSSKTGLLASTGSDGTIALYGEESETETPPAQDAQPEDQPGPGRWKLLTTVKMAHGPYEINHITWCPRYDKPAEGKGKEMLVSTGDEGLIRTWEVDLTL